MNYEKIESDRYENMWRSMRGEFHNEKLNYKSNVPSSELLDFVKFLKQKQAIIGKKALDIGCGNGRNSVALAKAGFDVTGIEVSESALSLAKKNEKENNVKINLQKVSVFNLPNSLQGFDLAIDFGLLHHLRRSQNKSYLKNVLNTIKPKGYFCLQCFSANTTVDKKPKNRNWDLIGKHYNRFFTNEEIKKVFGKHFEIIKIIETQNPRTKIKFFTTYMQRKGI